MAAAGADKSLKIWDIRNYKELTTYYTPTAANSLHISETGLLAVGWGPHVQVFKDVLGKGFKAQSPYMNHLLPGSEVSSVRFCPFEDVLGVGHSEGFSSVIVPGSGEANFDSLEVNPYSAATRIGRRETEVRSLLTKLQPSMISLDPDAIGRVNARAHSERLNAAALEAENENKAAADEQKLKPRAQNKGKNSAIRKYLRKKTANVIDQRRLRIEAALEKEKSLRKQRHRAVKGLSVEKEPYGAALKRFK
jgi:U3 small nucleolar RNA-associated protein 7